jgi:prepilin-type N-terminal cleavage/methylation domain-containing protein
MLSPTTRPLHTLVGLVDRQRRAFTIVELLVVLIVVSLLIVMTSIGLAEVRQRSRRAASMANLRTHAQVFGIYANEHGGLLPYFTSVGRDCTTVSGAGITLTGLAYFQAFNTWHIALADSYYAGRLDQKIFIPPVVRETPKHWPIGTFYYYGCSFLAHADYWNPVTRTGEKQYRATGISSVAFPSDKVLISQSPAFVTQSIPLPDDYEGDLLIAAFIDGAASAFPRGKLRPGCPDGDGEGFFDYGVMHTTEYPLMCHTLDGVEGRDRW